jgi:hypothetical protein
MAFRGLPMGIMLFVYANQKSGISGFDPLEINRHGDCLFSRLSALLALTRAGLKIAFVETDASEDPQVLRSHVDSILTNERNVGTF